MSDVVQAVADFWSALKAAQVPETWRGRLSGEEGYRVQLAIQERHDAEGDLRIGWKVAATSPEVQRQLGLSEPAFGSIRQSRRYEAGHRLDVAGLVMPHAESELCFQVNRNISSVRSREDVRFAIDRCYPSFEISEKRVPISDFGMCMADNAEHTAIILGEPINDIVGIDFRNVECRLSVDHEVVGTAKGGAVFGDPLNSIFWLKERLEAYGEALRPGMVVMTGSFIRQIPILAGQRFSLEFTGVGNVGFTAARSQ